MPTIKPKKIRVDASSVCQLRCRSCPNASGAIRTVIGSGFLKFSDFRMLVDENPWVTDIELSNYGEIFLNPQLPLIIEYAFMRGITLRADNGVNFNDVEERVLRDLVRYNFKSMSCSIDGASNETYKAYRIGGNFDTVLGNIERLNFYKRKLGSPLPTLRWQFVVFGHNEHEITAARQLATELNMSFRLKLSWEPEYSPVRNQDLVRKEAGAATREEYRELHGVDSMHSICNDLWLQPQINWDGKILGCSRNFWGEFGGSAFKHGLWDSINGEKISYARSMLVGEKSARLDIPCSTCNIYLDMKRSKRWLAGRSIWSPYRALNGIRRKLERKILWNK